MPATLPWLLLFLFPAQLPDLGPDPVLRGDSLVAEGRALLDASELREALGLLEEALRLRESVGDPGPLGRTLNLLGTIHYQLGNHDLALESYLASVEALARAGDRENEALARANVGLTYHDWGEYDRSRAAVEEAVAVAMTTDHAFARGYAHQILGRLELTLGRLEEAGAAYESAVALHDPGYRITAEAGRAAVFVAQGTPERAIPLLEAMLQAARASQAPRREARALYHLGQATHALGDPARAVALLEAGVELAGEADQRPLLLLLLAELSAVRESLGDIVGALDALRAHDTLRATLFSQATGVRIASMEARADEERQLRERRALELQQREAEATLSRQQAVLLGGGVLALAILGVLGVLGHHRRVGASRQNLLEARREALAEANRQLEATLSEGRTLAGMIPLCPHCKKVRTEEGYWEGVESFVSSRSEAFFSHGLCTECGPRVWGEDWDATLPRTTGRDPAIGPASDPGSDSGASPLAEGVFRPQDAGSRTSLPEEGTGQDTNG